MRFLIAFCAYLAMVLPTLAQDAAPILGETPAWVDELPLLAVDNSLERQAVDGVHYILSDHQLRWDGDIKQSYARTTLMVTDRAGLEQAATVSFDYDPKFDRIILTKLMIIRDGHEIDLLGKVQPEVFRREQRLDEGIIDGTLTAWLQVPDLRVGDILDYASVREMKPMALAGERNVWSILEWGVPVQLSRTIVLWPEGWGLNQAELPARVSYFSEPLEGGVVRHEYQRINHVPEPWEDNTPSEYQRDAVLRLTDLPDWGPVSAVLTPWYAADLPLTPDWDAKVAAIAAASDDPETRAVAALRLVQDELRYVSLSVGAGGYQARSPVEVITSGFGDCKDKSLLLTVILKRLGVESAVALTDIDEGRGLIDQVPMLGVFDHAIVRIRLDGESFWVDPTASHQGGDLTTGAMADYGWALPLTGPGQTRLELMRVTPDQGWFADVIESYDFTAEGVAFEVRTVLRGGAADATRQKLATTPVTTVSRAYLDYYENRYPGLVLVKDAEFSDDRASNRLDVTERYFLSRSALRGTPLETQFPFGTDNFVSNLPDRQRGKRVAPLDVGGPVTLRHHVRVRNAPLQFQAPQPVRISNPGFSFSMAAADTPQGSLSLDWTFQRHGNRVAPEQAAKVIEDAGQVYEHTWMTWDVAPDPGFGP